MVNPDSVVYGHRDFEAINLAYCVERKTIAELTHPGGTIGVAVEGIRERAAQDLKWGWEPLPDAPAAVKFHNAYFGICSEEAAKKNCEHAHRAGGCSLGHVLIEEVAEAIAAIPNPVHLRAELVQVMAVAMKWIEQIDRRQEVRHG